MKKYPVETFKSNSSSFPSIMPKDKKAPEEAVETETSLEQVQLKKNVEEDSSKQKKLPVLAVLGGETKPGDFRKE